MSLCLILCIFLLFIFRDFYVNHNSEYSTDTEWSQILKKAKNQNKSFLVIKLLNLKERRWNKENIIISDVNLIIYLT